MLENRKHEIESAAPRDPLVGQILNGRFQIEQRIGTGGMGRVYRAIQKPLGRTVAVKVVVPRVADDQGPSFLKRFFLEASVTAKLSHPNTITVFDFGSTPNGLAFLVMEYLQGRTLQELITTDGPLATPRAVHVALQIARSLREAHQLGVVHRDLKAANVMLVRHGDDDSFVKVLDFGLVKPFLAAAREAEDLTQEGLFVGSPSYVAPEQAQGYSDQRSDIYSLGIILFQMLTSRTPFRGRTSLDTILQHVRQPVPAMVGPVNYPIPPDVEAIVRRMLAKDPGGRFASMQEVIDAFKRCSVGEGSGQSGIVRQPNLRGTDLPPPQSAMPQLTTAHAVPATSPPPPMLTPFDVDVEEEEGGRTAGLGKKRILAAGICTGLALTFLFAIGPRLMRHSRRAAPSPLAAKVAEREPTPSPPAAPSNATAPAARVAFHVQSVPSGASVFEKGHLVGHTPLDLTRPLEADVVTVRLKLTHDGYEPQLAESSSTGGDRLVVVRLQKARAPEPARPRPRPGGRSGTGYRDDPY